MLNKILCSGDLILVDPTYCYHGMITCVHNKQSIMSNFLAKNHYMQILPYQIIILSNPPLDKNNVKPCPH